MNRMPRVRDEGAKSRVCVEVHAHQSGNQVSVAANLIVGSCEELRQIMKVSPLQKDRDMLRTWLSGAVSDERLFSGAQFDGTQSN